MVLWFDRRSSHFISNVIDFKLAKHSQPSHIGEILSSNYLGVAALHHSTSNRSPIFLQNTIFKVQ